MFGSQFVWSTLARAWARIESSKVEELTISLISPKELSKFLRVSKPWPYLAAKRGLLPYYKLGGLIRFKRADIEAFLEKNKIKGTRIVMQKELIALFKTFRQSGDWVFIKADGLPYQHWDVHKPFKAVLKSLKIDTAKFSWKEIRHTTGTLLHLKGADPLAIRDALRHTTVKTTESFYIGSDVEYQRQQNEKLALPQPTA